jgi:hypothetical protein
MFHNLESIIDKNNIKTEEKITSQSQFIAEVCSNQSSILDMCSDITTEIQKYFLRDVEPLNEHLKDVTNRLESEVQTLSFKGKEVKTIEQKIDLLVLNLSDIQNNQKIINNKIDSLKLHPSPLEDVKNQQVYEPVEEITGSKLQTSSIIPSTSDKKLFNNTCKITTPLPEKNISDAYLIDVDKEVRKQMLASIPKTSDWPTFFWRRRI